MMKTSAVVILVLSASGCFSSLEQISVSRASRELSCPEAELESVRRVDIAEDVFDFRGCGRFARYMCFAVNKANYHCAREPNPDPVEEAARQRWKETVAPPRS